MKAIIIGTLALILGFFALSSPTTSCEEDVYNKFVTIEGNVRTIEPETGKVFTPVGQNLIFQRLDCKRCLSITLTDENGYYKLRVGEGKYKLIVREDLSRGGSSLNPNQPEIIDAKDKVTRTVFDVKLVRHKNALDITLPSQE